MNGHGHPNGAHGSEGSVPSRGASGSNPPIAEIVGSAGETVDALRHHSVGCLSGLDWRMWQQLTRRRSGT